MNKTTCSSTGGSGVGCNLFQSRMKIARLSIKVEEYKEKI